MAPDGRFTRRAGRIWGTLGAAAIVGYAFLQTFSAPPESAVVGRPSPVPDFHPLDPLTAQEIRTASTVLRASPRFPDGGLFSTLVLVEPPKSEVLAYQAGAPSTRHAFSTIVEPRTHRTFEAVVDLRSERLMSWHEATDVQPPVLDSEYEILSRVVKANAEWQTAMRKRGITDLRQVKIDGWAAGLLASTDPGPRVLRALSYVKADSVNFYSRPIEGVVALVNMNTQEVIDLVDTGGVPIPARAQELDEKSTVPRVVPRPLRIEQPDGASFTIAGQEVRWQKWRFRFAMHPREGLVLHTVAYEDQGRLRSVLYRASLSEMVVPYGDSDKNWRWRAAFDVGEYGAGRFASAIEPNTDAPSNATLIDATLADEEGSPAVLQRAVSIYERDGGILWRHADSDSDRTESRRARQLVLGFIATIGNYDYSVQWVFHQDGVLEVDVALTGVLLPKGVPASASGHEGTLESSHLVAAGIAAPHHQHFFNFRLDFDVDGTHNSVDELNTRAAPAGPENPALNGMVMEDTPLRTEGVAQREVNLESSRTWRVFNPQMRNGLGHNTSYLLVPGANAWPYAAASASVRQRAGFINSHFWATRYNADEMYAAGAYPNQSRGGAGLPLWTANNESLVDQDVVVWYTLGLTHIPRPEEWPVMSATHVGFKMAPADFFSSNPGLDVPR